MSGSSEDSKKSRKLIKPKLSASPPVHPETSSSRLTHDLEESREGREVLCPLLAKDSEWVDIIETPAPSVRATSSPNISDDEEIVQLVECEERSQIRPLAVMFPDLLIKDPRALQGMLNKTMSTTEVTRTLVDLGQKADFKFMKKTDRLIPPDKKWLESLTEYSSSIISDYPGESTNSDYEGESMDMDEYYLDYFSEAKDITPPPGSPITLAHSVDQDSVIQVLSEVLQKICDDPQHCTNGHANNEDRL